MQNKYTKMCSILLTLAMLLALLPSVAFAAGKQPVAIDEATFPDANFRSYIANNFDSDHDSLLSQAELNAITAISVDNENIADLTGIANFPNLAYLHCDGNQLTALDISDNPALVNLTCGRNQLTSLELRNNPALTILDCADNQLTSLNLYSASKLVYLDCFDNRLTALDISKNTALNALQCSCNALTVLDTHANPELSSLDCWENQLTALNLDSNPALAGLDCHTNRLTTLDMGSKPELVGLDCHDNQLTELYVSGCPALWNFDCSRNQLACVDMRNNENLWSVDCSENQRVVAVSAERTFDLSTIPGFRMASASDWRGGTVQGTILHFNADADFVTYFYDCGNARADTFTLISDIPGPLPFTDVKKDSWYENDVRFVFRNGLMVGTDETTFRPQSPTTRGMIVTILYRLEDEPPISCYNPFRDVPAGKYYSGAVEWALYHDIVYGYTQDKFGPNDSVTREQLATFLFRYAMDKDYSTSDWADLSGFVDANKISNYADIPMRWAVGAGLLYGKENRTLDPRGKATRAEVAAILHRFYENVILQAFYKPARSVTR